MESLLHSLSPFWRPHAGQLEFLQSAHRYRVLACGRRWGKTDACAVAVLAECHPEHDGRTLIVAPTQVQTETLFERVAELAELAFPDTPIKRRTTPYPSLRIGDYRVFARSGHVPRSLRGQGADHIVIDEAAFVTPDLITEVAFPMLATTNGRMTLLSTPRGKNLFWRLFDKGQRLEAPFWSRQAPSSESPYVDAQFLAIQRDLVAERVFQVEYEAAFLDAAGAVFSSEAVEACTVSRFKQDPAGPFVIGVDWARYTDFTAVAVLSGHREQAQLAHLERFNGLSWSQQVDKVAHLVRMFPAARVLCDKTGVGDPVLEMLQRALPDHHVEGLTLTSATKQEIVESLAAMLDRRSLEMLPHVDLLRELHHFEATLSPSGNVRLGAASGFHDDAVIALALGCRQLPQAYRPIIASAGSRRFSRPHHEPNKKPLSTETSRQDPRDSAKHSS